MLLVLTSGALGACVQAPPNFRAAWEALPEDSEREDDYGLGQRDGLQVGGWCRRGGSRLGQRGGGRWGGGRAVQASGTACWVLPCLPVS